MDPKGNSLGQINTHSRHTVGNGSEPSHKAERKRPQTGLERGIGSVYTCVRACVRACPSETPTLPSCTCYEREKQRIGRAVFASVSISSGKHRRPGSVNNLVVVCPREVETSRPAVLSPADDVRRYSALDRFHENSPVDSPCNTLSDSTHFHEDRKKD